MLTSLAGLRRRLRLVGTTAAAAGAALVLTVPGPALAAPGDLDPTFGGGDGKVITDLIYYEDSRDMVLQSDGKILTVGTLTPAEGGENGSDFSLLRYHPDGSPDTAFGDGGAVTTDLSSRSAPPGGVREQARLIDAIRRASDDCTGPPALVEDAAARCVAEGTPAQPKGTTR